ncbi:MAG: hypothetical protein LBF74_14825 [Treponema sp.]|nr:hypothetical protein [Treponema sp.]
MEALKNVLIVTDGTESIRDMAEKITETLAGCRVVSIEACNFSGVQILPAEVYFFGCEKPNPPSFRYLEDVLNHINLAGRVCGVFSSRSGEAVNYLSDMVRDSELALHREPLLSSEREKIKNWVGDLIH